MESHLMNSYPQRSPWFYFLEISLYVLRYLRVNGTDLHVDNEYLNGLLYLYHHSNGGQPCIHSQHFVHVGIESRRSCLLDITLWAQPTCWILNRCPTRTPQNGYVEMIQKGWISNLHSSLRRSFHITDVCAKFQPSKIPLQTGAIWILLLELSCWCTQEQRKYPIGMHMQAGCVCVCARTWIWRLVATWDSDWIGLPRDVLKVHRSP